VGGGPPWCTRGLVSFPHNGAGGWEGATPGAPGVWSPYPSVGLVSGWAPPRCTQFSLPPQWSWQGLRPARHAVLCSVLCTVVRRRMHPPMLCSNSRMGRCCAPGAGGCWCWQEDVQGGLEEGEGAGDPRVRPGAAAAPPGPGAAAAGDAAPTRGAPEPGAESARAPGYARTYPLLSVQYDTVPYWTMQCSAKLCHTSTVPYRNH